MQNMEFLSRNLANTSTLITVNTGTASYLIDRLSTLFSGSMSTSTAATVTVNFALGSVETNRIVIENMNFKNFSLNVGGVPLTMSAIIEGTQTASWTGNSATSMYIQLPTSTVNTLTMIVNSNTDGGNSHTLEQIWISKLLYQFDQNPASKDFKVSQKRKEYVHKLSDGGTIQYVLGDYYNANIKIEHIEEDMKSSLRSVYDEKEALVFSPYPTTTGWDRECYEVLWTGDFNFIQRAHNLKSAGYSGSLKLVETGK